MRFPPGDARSAIYVMRAGGGSLRRVTPQRLDAGHPSWSPDGRRIVFNDRFTQPVGDIFTIRPDGRGLRRLTSVAAGGQAGFRPDYSPDGTRIVFDHSGAGGTLQLWVMRADGSAQHPLATGLVDPVGPRWGPRLG
jgi:Tol biopolymer transport system component